ncbi:hypothetical protein [Dickeya oryzae]
MTHRGFAVKARHCSHCFQYYLASSGAGFFFILNFLESDFQILFLLTLLLLSLAATLRAIALRYQKFLPEIFGGLPSLAATLWAIALRYQKFLPEIF